MRLRADNPHRVLDKATDNVAALAVLAHTPGIPNSSLIYTD